MASKAYDTTRSSLNGVRNVICRRWKRRFCQTGFSKIERKMTFRTNTEKFNFPKWLPKPMILQDLVSMGSEIVESVTN